MIRILEETTKHPLQKIGMIAGICWNAPVEDKEKNIKRAKDCIKSGHGRVLEFVDIEILIEGYSARVIREYERHHIGASFLQQSTRYCKWDMGNTKVNISKKTSVLMTKDAETNDIFNRYGHAFSDLINELDAKGIPKEDIAMFYPLGMETKIVDKRNLRSLVEMSHQRLCSRAYWEYRELMAELVGELKKVSDEWEWICDSLFVPKCEIQGVCHEIKCCGRKPKAE